MAVFWIFFVLALPSLVLSQCTCNINNVHDVFDYGAIGDGFADDTHAFMKAWDATCNSSSSFSSMNIPAKKTFLVHPLTFQGPCNSKNIHVEINGKITGPSEPSEWECGESNCKRWLHFDGVDGLSLHGFGTIDGQGEKWWQRLDHPRPSALEIGNCNNVRISGLSLKNNPHVHIVLDRSKNVSVSNIDIDAPATSPNTDGINIRECTNVFINHARIGTGDDCISIVGGSSFIRVNDITCGPGHGISIGSLGKGGRYEEVEYVHVSNVVFRRSTNGLRIKTWQGGRGFARRFKFERITTEGADNPIIIDQYYFANGNTQPNASAVQISNVTYSNIRGTSMKNTAIKLACSSEVPCTDIYMEDVNIVTRHGRRGRNASAHCENVHGRAHGEIVPSVHCLKYT